MADPGRMVQVLGNLLSNAAENSSQSSPIRITGARQGALVAITVSHDGRGIAPDKVPHLFRKRPATAEGTGLGLAICKGLVEAHGGRIRAESGGVGTGARFTFTIPVAASAAPEAEPSDFSDRAPGQNRRKTPILVVDDDPETLRYARAVLSDSGYAAIVTAEAERLPDIIRSESPRLVLLDLMLPGTDGIELMGQVPELADVPVIFISAYGRDETIARALESGAVDYIVKPFSPTELVARVRAALRGRSEPETFALGDLTIDYELRRVRLGGRRLSLTAIEFDLLRVLSLHAGAVVPTYVLLRQVWGTLQADKRDRVRSAIKRLRKKLGDDAEEPTYICTEHGIGYRMPDQDEG